jgi:integrase/recombinase XerD
VAQVVSTQIERFLDHLSVERGLSGNTVSAYRRDLARYASYLASRGVRDARAVVDAPVARVIHRE